MAPALANLLSTLLHIHTSIYSYALFWIYGNSVALKNFLWWLWALTVACVPSINECAAQTVAIDTGLLHGCCISGLDAVMDSHTYRMYPGSRPSSRSMADSSFDQYPGQLSRTTDQYSGQLLPKPDYHNQNTIAGRTPCRSRSDAWIWTITIIL